MKTAEESWVKEFYERQRNGGEDERFSEMKKVSDFLRRAFQSDVERLNSRYDSDAIKVLSLPLGLLRAIFGVRWENPGFLIIFGASKLVMVLSSEDGSVTFIGRKMDSPQKNSKNLKLLRVFCREEETGKYLFKDSTGMNVETGELVVRVIRWGTG